MTEAAPLPINGMAITARVCVTCLGRGREAHLAAMRAGSCGLTPCDYADVDVPCFIGRVAGIEDDAFPRHLRAFDNRAARLALAALAADGFAQHVRAACARFGRHRVGLVLGTSTSGIERLERVYRARRADAPLASDYSMRHHNDYHAVTSFLFEHLGLGGPGYTVSTACSSSAKAIVDATQLIQAGLCDAVLAGGVDSLCMTSLCGFDALELVARAPCRPCDTGRDGLSVGEGAGFVLIERGGDGPRLAGFGETSDAVSMSTPPPDGAGAAAAMRRALARAGLAPEAIGLVKLHGTATPANDAAECAAVAEIFGQTVPAASLKGMIGHTLGAAGAVEAVMCLDAMEAGILPANVGLETQDPAI
ncbi:MAG TPA: beta-ketoacyl synthase N-terminal-like domain-containing protein, partial [Thermohalobaculum sp.]|nr:beta-ketoacyl synthase N-terminal-like domain-containing protein [Thermohalobaculum sp.]